MDGGLVAMFMEITSCETQAYAVQQLSSCGWNLERAINLYFTAGPSGVARSPPPVEEESAAEEDEVRAPIPARFETLYGDSSYNGRRGAPRGAPTIWDAPPPAPVRPVPVQVLSISEIDATGWVEAEPDGGGNGSLEAQEDAQEEDDGSVRERGMASDKEEDGEEREDEEDDEENNVSDSEYKEEEEVSDSEYGEQDNFSDNEYKIEEDYGLEIDDEDAYNATVMEEEPSSDRTEGEGDEEQPLPPPAKKSLAEMYRPPYELMYHGNFHNAKVYAARKDQFLLVNLQTRREFASQLQNRDLWADQVVSQVVKDNLVFLLLEKLDHYSDEGSKVCSFYRLGDDELPAVLVLDPITGQMLAKLCGAIQPDEFMLFIDEYTKTKPSTMSKPKIVRKTPAVPAESSASAAAGGEQEPAAKPESSASADARGDQEPAARAITEPAGQEPGPVTDPAAIEPPPAETVVDFDEEPMEGEKMYKLRVRFPDGNVVAKEFGCKRRVAALFAFCRSAVRDAGKTEEQKAFRIMTLAGRAFVEIQDQGATFEDLGLNYAIASVVFNT